MPDILNTAKSCYLKISDNNADKFKQDINNMIKMIETLSDMEEFNDEEKFKYMTLRKDEIKKSLTREEVLMNTKSKAGCFLVSKTLDK